jgi:hypothetical protein
MRLTWLDVNASFSHASLALPLLHAACAREPRLRAAWDWDSVRGTSADDPGRLAARVAATAPDVLAATVYLFNRATILRTVRRVRALRPACQVLLGGPEFLGDNEPFLRREPGVTAVVRGEGEESLPLWLAHAHAPDRWPGVPGLCWLDAAGEYHDGGLALAAHAILAAPPDASPFLAWDRPFVQLETSRGCPFRCAFCCSARTGAPRWLPLEGARHFLRAARERGIREVRVLDRTFNAEPARAAECLDLFLGEFPELRFHLEIHPAFLPAALRRQLAAAPKGALHLEVGLQTRCAAALAALDRAGEPARAWDGLAFLCACRNLDVHVDLLAGLPGVGFAELLADVHSVVGLGPAEIQLETLKVLPGTPLRERAVALGLAFAPDPPYEVLRTPQLAPEEMLRAQALSWALDQFRNPAPLRDPFAAALAAVPDFLRAFLDAVAAVAGTPLSLENRFRRLHAFTAARAPDAAAALERAWLQAGLTPGRCPGQVRPWRGPVPPEAVASLGREDARVPAAGRHAYVLEQADTRFWYVFERGRDRQRPVALFHAPQARPERPPR